MSEINIQQKVASATDSEITQDLVRELFDYRESYNGKLTSSKFKGVSWSARIQINGKSKHLGYFTSEIDAAKTYNKTAISEFGEFAKLNEVVE